MANLPDLKAKVKLDLTDLETAAAKASLLGAALQKELGGTRGSEIDRSMKAVGASTAALGNSFVSTAVSAEKLGTAHTRVITSTHDVSKAHEEATGKLKTMEESTSRVSALFGEYGSVGEKLTQKLGALSGLAGLTGVGLAGTVAAAGIGAVVVVGKEAVDSFVAMADKVLNFQRATGASAEESSRLVDVFQQVGISGDQAAAAMFRMNSRLEGTTPATAKVAERLAALGVEVVKNKDGTVELTQTLENVAAAYVKAGDGSQKDAIAFQAFGRSGRDLIPILEQGATGIKAMSDQAQLLFTQQQLEQVKNYETEMERLNQEHERFNQTIGGAVVPVLTGLVENFNKYAEATRYANEKTKEMGLSSRSTGQEFQKYYEEGLRAAEASRQSAAADSELTAAAKTAAAAIAAKTKEEDADAKAALGAADAWRKNADSQDRVIKAADAVKTIEHESADFTAKHRIALEALAIAQDKYNDAVSKSGTSATGATNAAAKHKIAVEGVSIAQDKYNDASAKYGATSDQAVSATKALDTAKLHLSETDIAAASASGKSSAAAAAGNDAVAAAAKGLQQAQLSLGDVESKNQSLADRLNAAYQAESDAMITAAKDAVDLADKQQQTTGPAQTAMEKQLALIKALRDEEVTLAPDSPLRRNIDGYIFQLETPAVKAAEDLEQKTHEALLKLEKEESALFIRMGTTTSAQVQSDTEHQIQLWEEHKSKLVGHSIIPDMVNAIGGEFTRLRVNTDAIMGATTTNLVNHAANIAGGMYSNIKGGLDSVLRIIHDFATQIDKALGGFGVNIPVPQISPFAQGPSGVHSLAQGGVIPGYAPGQDVVPAMLSPGEGVLTPQTVLGLGGAGAIEALNSVHGLGAATLANVGSLANIIGSIAGQCVVAVEKWTGHFFPVAFASQMTAWINSRIPAPGEIFVSTIPPFGHTGLVIGPNQVLDSNWGLDARVRVHALSDIPSIAGYISGFGAPNVGGLTGLPGLGLSLGAILKGLIEPLTTAAHAAANLIPEAWARPLASGLIDKVVSNIAGRASGGPVLPGHLYTVGERGPELFSPGVPGQITPTGGGVSVNVQGGYFSSRELAQQLARDVARELHWQSLTRGS